MSASESSDGTRERAVVPRSGSRILRPVLWISGLAVAGILGLTWVWSLFRIEWPERQHLDARMPRFATLAERPDAASYSRDVPDCFTLKERSDSEPAAPIDPALVRGQILSVDRDLPTSTWLIRTREMHPDLSTHLYALQEESGELQEIVRLPSDLDIGWSYLCRGEREGELHVLSAMHPRRSWAPERDEIWSCPLAGGEATRISNGTWLTPSTDRRRAAFLRSDGAGFHCYYWLNVSTGRVQPILSLWEVDPGSGASFCCHWSQDSRVLRIHGEGLGFEKRRGSHRIYDLVYFVDEDLMVSMN